MAVGQCGSSWNNRLTHFDFSVFGGRVVQLEKLIEKNYYLHKSAQEAYKSYVRAYDSHSLKQIYSVNTLNLPMVALSFGFKVPPYVDLSILSLRFSLKRLVTKRVCRSHFRPSGRWRRHVIGLDSTSLQTCTAAKA